MSRRGEAYLKRAQEFLSFMGGIGGNFVFDFVEICGGFGGTAFIGSYLAEFISSRKGKAVVFTKFSNHAKVQDFTEMCGVSRLDFESRVLVLSEGHLRSFLDSENLEEYELFVYDDAHLLPFEFFTSVDREEKVVANLDRYATLVSFFRGSILFADEDLSADGLLAEQRKEFFHDLQIQGVFESEDGSLYVRFPGATSIPFLMLGQTSDNGTIDEMARKLDWLVYEHGVRVLFVSSALTGFCAKYRSVMERELLENGGLFSTTDPEAFECVRDVYNFLFPFRENSRRLKYVNGYFVPQGGFRLSKAVFKNLINGLRGAHRTCVTAFFKTDINEFMNDSDELPEGTADGNDLSNVVEVVAEEVVPRAEGNVIILSRHPSEALSLYNMLKERDSIREHVSTLTCKKYDRPYARYDENIEIFSGNAEAQRAVLIVSLHNLSELRVKAKSVSDVVIVGNPFLFNAHVASELARNMFDRKQQKMGYNRIISLLSEWNLMLGLWKVGRKRKGTRLYFMDCSFLRKKNFLMRLRTDFGALIIESIF